VVNDDGFGLAVESARWKRGEEALARIDRAVPQTASSRSTGRPRVRVYHPPWRRKPQSAWQELPSFPDHEVAAG
jgi:hypothetical protein